MQSRIITVFLGSMATLLTQQSVSAETRELLCTDSYYNIPARSDAVYKLSIKTDSNGAWKSAYGSKVSGTAPGNPAFAIDGFSTYFCSNKRKDNQFTSWDGKEISVADCGNVIPQILPKREGDYFLIPYMFTKVYATEQNVFLQFDVTTFGTFSYIFKCH